MRAYKAIIVAAMLGVPAVSAVAQDRSYQYEHDAIESGRFGEAEAALRSQLALEPTKPELLINLAAIYARTNRLDDAQALYQRALNTEDVSLLLKPDVALNSHEIAHRGLRKLDRLRTAAK